MNLKGKTRVIILIGWLGFIGFDLFLHAGLLARLYHEENLAILDPLQAFYRIPIGYFAFFIYVVFLYWLLKINNFKYRNEILKFVFQVGLFISVSSTLAQYSILKINDLLLFGWGLGLIIEFLISGLIVGYLMTNYSSKRMLINVIVFDVLLFFITVIMQNTGLAPPLVVATHFISLFF
jgi:hypothetical protein